MISPLRMASVSGVWTSSGICSHALIVSGRIPLARDQVERLPRPPQRVDRGGARAERLHSLADDREADIARCRGCGERLRDGLQLARLLLGPAPLGLLHREPRLVGEPPHHCDHRRSRLRDLALPLQREDPLELGADHDRDAKRGVQAKPLGVPQRLPARPLLRVRDEHRPERAHLLDQAREVGEVDPACPEGSRRSAGRARPPRAARRRPASRSAPRRSQTPGAPRRRSR